MEIRVFQSHMEIYPYEKGQCEKLERMLSRSKRVNRNWYEYEPIAYYIENHILYIPKGISPNVLEKFFGVSPVPMPNADPYEKIKKGKGLRGPKNRMQDEGMQFLLGTGNFNYTGWYSQLGLNLSTGDGKTYATIYTILQLKMKAIIITNQEKVKREWINELTKNTDFPMENLVNISGSDVIDKIFKGKIKGEIYCVNHQTLASYAREHGWAKIHEFFKKIKVGIKVVDEAHKFFQNTLMIDFFSNCYKNIYLTATYGRAANNEKIVYKRAFQSLARFGEETINYEEKRKHINFIGVYFNSKPPYGTYADVKTGFGFSSYKYIDYEFNEATNHALIKLITILVKKALELEGKLLVLTPKVETVEFMKKYIEDLTDIPVAVIHGGISDENVEKAKSDYRIISSTNKSVGEGVNIKGLRVIILSEPVGTDQVMDQVIGRLREYSDEDETYVFYPIDLTIPDITRMLKAAMPALKRKCKTIKYISIGGI